MGVNGVNQVSGVSGVYNKQGVTRVEKSKETQGKKDEISISNSGQDFNTVMKALKEVPNVREEKVAELAVKVESGTYNAPEDGVADKLMENFLGKKV